MTDKTRLKKAPTNISFSAGMSPGKLPKVDGRSWLARRYRELVLQISDDLGGELPAAKLAIVCRAATLTAWAEQAEGEFARTGELDVQQFTTAVNALRRLLADLGLERQSKNITPTLEEYLQEREGEA